MAEVAEGLLQFGQIGGRGRQRLGGVEGIIKTPELGGARHELGNALRAFGTDGAGIEQAFLPDQAGHEGLWQAMLQGAGGNLAADGHGECLALILRLGEYRRRTSPGRSQRQQHGQDRHDVEQAQGSFLPTRAGLAVNRRLWTFQ